MTYEFKKIGLDTDEFWFYFNKITNECKYLDALLNRSNINWWKEIYSSNNWLLEDKTFCLLSSNEPYFIFMGFLMKKDELKKLHLLSRPCFGIETTELNSKKRKNINTEITQLINKNRVSFSINSSKNNHLNPYFYEFLLKNRLFMIENSFSKQILIDQSEEKLWSGLRSSYKSLVNWGLRELDIHVYTKDNINLDIVESFRKLHFEEAGCETRSRASWLLQLEAVTKDEAFIVTAKSDGKLVSAGYFIINKVHSFYGSSASKFREIEKPLFHALMWKAILYCKEREIIFFETGNQYSRQEILEKEIDSKNINIASFKSGFGGALFDRGCLTSCES